MRSLVRCCRRSGGRHRLRPLLQKQLQQRGNFCPQQRFRPGMLPARLRLFRRAGPAAPPPRSIRQRRTLPRRRRRVATPAPRLLRALLPAASATMGRRLQLQSIRAGAGSRLGNQVAARFGDHARRRGNVRLQPPAVTERRRVRRRATNVKSAPRCPSAFRGSRSLAKV